MPCDAPEGTALCPQGQGGIPQVLPGAPKAAGPGSLVDRSLGCFGQPELQQQEEVLICMFKSRLANDKTGPNGTYPAKSVTLHSALIFFFPKSNKHETK